jgi:hypothetical protein
MKRVFLLVFLLGGLNGFAQDSLRIPRNEVSFNAVPLFGLLAGEIPGLTAKESRITGTYKRSLPKYSFVWLRAGAAVIAYSDEQFFSNTSYMPTDSTQVLVHNYVSRRPTFELFAGFELRTGERGGWSAFTFCDFFANVKESRKEVRSVPLKKDSSGDWTANGDAVTSTLRTVSQAAGVYPGLGGRYAFSPRWVMSAQTGLQLPILPFRTDINSLRFSAKLVGQFDVVYRF